MTIKWYVWMPLAILLLGGAFAFGWKSHQLNLFGTSDLINPLTSRGEQQAKEKPLEKYALATLAEQTFTTDSEITIGEEVSDTSTSTSYVFSYQTQGKTITGHAIIPKQPVPASGYPVIVMLRGYVPLDIYSPGLGTRNAAAVYAEQGFVTIAPDFLGYGGSDPDYTDTWETRFIKPLQVAELLAAIEQYPSLSNGTENSANAITVKLNPDQVGLWGHSNGGQIALATLEITHKPLPTVLWAPVTAPFPYSILFFSDELADEGKEQRAWIALFEEDYDVFDFSLTQHLDLLPGTAIQLHHGTADDAALIAWSDEFVDKIKLENERREELRTKLEAELATDSARAAELEQQIQQLGEIELTYHRYPGADHNLRPSWDTVVQRDVAFFNAQLKAN